MNVFRWIIFIPFAAIVAVVFGVLFGSIFPSAFYSKDHLTYAMIGLLPLFAGRLLPVIIFICLGAAIAPKKSRILVLLLGILGGIFGLPIDRNLYLGPDLQPFFWSEVIGALLGAVIGVFIVFFLQNRRSMNRG